MYMHSRWYLAESNHPCSDPAACSIGHMQPRHNWMRDKEDRTNVTVIPKFSIAYTVRAGSGLFVLRPGIAPTGAFPTSSAPYLFLRHTATS
jgi:hypothetical protein